MATLHRGLHRRPNHDLATLAALASFVAMMARVPENLSIEERTLFERLREIRPRGG